MPINELLDPRRNGDSDLSQDLPDFVNHSVFGDLTENLISDVDPPSVFSGSDPEAEDSDEVSPVKRKKKIH